MGQDWASSEWFSLNEALDTVPLCNNDSYSIPGKHSVVIQLSQNYHHPASSFRNGRNNQIDYKAHGVKEASAFMKKIIKHPELGNNLKYEIPRSFAIKKNYH